MRRMRDEWATGGRCPACLGHDGYLATEKKWFAHCVEHHVCWRVIAKEAGVPTAAERDRWVENIALLAGYREIRPCFNLSAPLSGSRLETAMLPVKESPLGRTQGWH